MGRSQQIEDRVITDHELAPEAASNPPAAQDPVVRGRRLANPAPTMVLGGIGILVGYLVLALIYGALPGQLPNAAAAMWGGGMSTCFAQDFPRNLLSCHSVAYPNGGGSSFGLAFTVTAGFLQLAGLSLVGATRLVMLVVLAVGWWGARRLSARFTDRSWIAWTASFALLTSPIMSAQGSYGPLQLAFVLVPVVLLTDVRFVEAFDPGTSRHGTDRSIDRAGRIRRFAVMLVARSLLMLLDPYSFMICAMLAGVFYLMTAVRMLRRRRVGPAVTTSAAFVVSGAVAFGLQILTAVPVGESMGLGFFRGQGVDVFAQFVPSPGLWWTDLSGWHHTVNATAAYSDGHNIHDVYWGFSLLFLALFGLVAAFRNTALSRVRWIAAGGFGCAVLALGPSLKIADFRVVAPIAHPAAADYVMPEAEAGNTTPWSWVYQNVPGFEQMRALYRWELGGRVALVLLAVVGLTYLARGGRFSRWVAGALAVVMVVEAMPNLPDRWQVGAEQLAVYEGIDTSVIQPMADIVRPGERIVLYTPAKASPGENTYMANQLCSALRARCTNIGGDKASIAAANQAPENIAGVTFRRDDITDAQADSDLRGLLSDRTVDAVVLTNFDLLLNTYSWPATAADQAASAAAAAKMLTGPGFAKSGTEWFTVVRRAG